MSEEHPTLLAEPPTRPSIDIDSLRNFLDSIRSFAGEALILERPDVSNLYHYTDYGGFRGIVENRDLWLTHLRFSNDEEEMTHGKKLVFSTLEAMSQSAHSEREVYLRALKELLQQPVADGVYICCFCEKDNLLSQWRGYGANGVGVSVEIQPQVFEHLTGPDCPYGLMRLWKVFYEEKRQRSIIEKAIEFAWMSTHLPPEKRAQNAADAIQFFIPTFKNTDFAGEEEWRLIFTPAPMSPVKPEFRIGRNLLVPYYRLQALGWGAVPLPITGVCIGPGVHRFINAESVRMLLDQNGYSNVPIRVSQTPYRG